MLAAALVTALVLPAATQAKPRAIPRGAVATIAHAKKAKPVVEVVRPSVDKQRHGTAPRNVILPYVFGAASPAPFLGDVENCASYTGCTADELCLVWGLGCERLAITTDAAARVAEEVQEP